MSYYVITKIRVNEQAEVTSAVTRTLVDAPAGGRSGDVGAEVEMSSQEVADLLLQGDQVFVGVDSGEEGFFELTHEVRSSDDDEPLLESFDENGETSTALADLPRLP